MICHRQRDLNRISRSRTYPLRDEISWRNDTDVNCLEYLRARGNYHCEDCDNQEITNMNISKTSFILTAAFTGLLGGTMARLSASPAPSDCSILPVSSSRPLPSPFAQTATPAN